MQFFRSFLATKSIRFPQVFDENFIIKLSILFHCINNNNNNIVVVVTVIIIIIITHEIT